METQLLKATPLDVQVLSRLGRETFLETYTPLLPDKKEILQAYVNEAFSASRIAGELTDEHISYYLMHRNGRIVGYAKTVRGIAPTYVSLLPALELERFYIQAGHHRAGLGKMALEKIKAEAVSQAFRSLWLSVFELNTPALQFYEKAGFKIVGQKSFTIHHAGLLYSDTDFVLELNLV